MLDERKVELMTQLAFYEQTEGKEDFKISEFYRKDYTSLHMICSVLWVTVGYVCAVGLFVLVKMEDILENVSNNLIVMLAGAVILGYISLIIVYLIITNHVFNTVCMYYEED